jgi:hypothetical protein
MPLSILPVLRSVYFAPLAFAGGGGGAVPFAKASLAACFAYTISFPPCINSPRIA